MRTHVTAIEIDADPAAAFDFLADAEKLPLWAIGFAKAIAPDGEGWLVTLASGDRMPMRIEADRATGVVDYRMQPAPGVEVPAHTRVMPRAGGTLYTFAMHQGPGIPDDVFDAQIAELERELTVLSAHLETACPL